MTITNRVDDISLFELERLLTIVLTRQADGTSIKKPFQERKVFGNDWLSFSNVQIQTQYRFRSGGVALPDIHNGDITLSKYMPTVALDRYVR